LSVLKILHCNSTRRRWFWFLGVSLGLGLLTKAFFLPISAGVIVFLIYMAIRKRDRELLEGAGKVFFVAAMIGGWWYVQNYLLLGSLTGGADFVRDSRAGFFEGLIQNFSVGAVVRGYAVIAASFYWAGTWSLTHPPTVMLIPPLLLLLATISLGLWRSWRSGAIVLFTPIVFVVPLLLGLTAHMLSSLAAEGKVLGTPGWYLHILAGPIALVLAVGWGASGWLLLAFSTAFTPYAWALQLALFSGCAWKSPAKQYVFHDACWIDTTRLERISHANLGFIFCASAIAILVYCSWRLLHMRRQEAHRRVDRSDYARVRPVQPGQHDR
jgi:hypothetical protein